MTSSTTEALAPSSSTPRAAPREVSLRVNFSWTLVGNIIYAGCQWAMLIVLARLGRAEMVGQFALGLAIAAPVIMCCNLNLRSVQATDARREYSFSDYLRLRVVTTALALCVIAGIAFFTGHSRATVTVIVLVGIAKCIEALSDVFYGLLQQNEEMQRIAMSMMIKGPLSLIALAAALWLTGSLIVAVVALCGAWLVVLLLFDVRNGLKSLQDRMQTDPHVTKHSRESASSLAVALRLAWLAAPMGLVMFLISLNSNIPRYFIERQLGLRELGIFSAIAYLMVVGSTLVTALGQSATPRLARFYADEKHAAFVALVAKLITIATAIGVAGVLIAWIAGRPLLEIVYGAEYSPHAALFTWLMAVAWLGYVGSIFGYGLSAARRFRIQAPLYLFALIATLFACALLVPRFGVLGAAWALGIGATVQTIFGAVVMSHALRTSSHKVSR